MIRSRRHQALAPRTCAAAALVSAAMSLTACVGDNRPPRPAAAPVATLAPIPRDKAVAIVAGTPVSGAAYADRVAQQLKGMAAQARQQPGITVPTEQQIRSQALNSVVDTAVINHYAQQHGITATAQEVQQQYDAVRAGQPVTFTDVLTQYGFTVASFKKALADGIVSHKVELRVAPPGLVEAVRARHILIGPPPAQTGTLAPTTKAKPDSAYRAEAMAIYQQLRKDPNRFAALARQKSIDTGSAARGGELGWFPKGMTVLPFEKAAFSLPVGQISPPVKSQFGYHIIQVEEHKKIPFTALPQSAQQTPTVQAQVRKWQTQLQNWLSAERKRDHVRILYRA
jgi:parvulin-like peptidyl-prolyl isomerase